MGKEPKKSVKSTNAMFIDIIFKQNKIKQERTDINAKILDMKRIGKKIYYIMTSNCAFFELHGENFSEESNLDFITTNYVSLVSNFRDYHEIMTKLLDKGENVAEPEMELIREIHKIYLEIYNYYKIHKYKIERHARRNISLWNTTFCNPKLHRYLTYPEMQILMNNSKEL